MFSKVGRYTAGTTLDKYDMCFWEGMHDLHVLTRMPSLLPGFLGSQSTPSDNCLIFLE